MYEPADQRAEQYGSSQILCAQGNALAYGSPPRQSWKNQAPA